MDWLFVIGLALSSSVDNLAVGVSYGVRGVRIDPLSNLLIAVICFVLSEVGLLLGGQIGAVLPDGLPDLCGALVLLVLGLRILVLALPRSSDDACAAPTREASRTWRDMLAQPAKIFRAPPGRIGWLEAAILGVALSANALTNGFGAGLIGLPATAVALTAAVGSFAAVAAGITIGVRVAKVGLGAATLGRYGTALSGAILVVLAVVNLRH